MRILFVCRHIGSIVGGVERSAINLMNEMVGRGHDISLITWDAAGSSAFFPMDDRIDWMCMDAGDPMRKAGLLLRIKRIRKYRGYVRDRRPDVVIGYQHGAFLFAAMGLLPRRIPVVLAERNTPDRMEFLREGRYRRWVFQSMRLAAAITVQLKSYVERYPVYLRDRIVAIPNPVYAPDGTASPGADRPTLTLLSVGRLSYQKNYESLVRAFASVADDFPAWKLRIVGEGERRPEIEALVSELSLSDLVELPGPVRDVSAEYRSSDLFCLPSLWEGFPNTLAEAMAHGLPCVAFADCAGSNELIRHDVNGMLAAGNGDTGTLADALRRLMADAATRRRQGASAREITNTYKPQSIFDRWEQLFREVAGGR
jgi:glycosyltransferase involved in cell wall biosynthesis